MVRSRMMRYWFMDGCWVILWSMNRCVRCWAIMWFTFIFDISNETIGMVCCISNNLGTTIGKGYTIFTIYDSIFILSLLFVKVGSCIFIRYAICICERTWRNFVRIAVMFRCWRMIWSGCMGK